ncbi:MAG TPA: NAD-dependent epimerase/dehydratase family protein [Candidatus Binatia bacterium]|jgi:UDP-glucose 4-epimerase
MTDRRILVTGGAGFIGSHIVEDLLLHGYDVTVLDNLSSGRRENLAAVSRDVRFVEGDLADGNLLARAMRGQRFVSHMAAQLEIIRCSKDPLADLDANTVATLRVLNAAVEAGLDKMVNASSACVYGQAVHVPASEDGHPKNPNWAYGVSKLAAEHYCRLFHESGRLATTSLRFAIVYGQREWCGRVITMMLRRALRGLPPVVFGAGDQSRDFIHVDDVVRCHRLALESDAANGLPFNVSTGIGTDVSTLAGLCAEVTGLGQPPIFEDTAQGETSQAMPDRVRLPQELHTMILDPTRANQLLGFRAETLLRTGLAREWAWIRKQPDRWNSLSI